MPLLTCKAYSYFLISLYLWASQWSPFDFHVVLWNTWFVIGLKNPFKVSSTFSKPIGCTWTDVKAKQIISFSSRGVDIFRSGVSKLRIGGQMRTVEHFESALSKLKKYNDLSIINFCLSYIVLLKYICSNILHSIHVFSNSIFKYPE